MTSCAGTRSKYTSLSTGRSWKYLYDQIAALGHMFPAGWDLGAQSRQVQADEVDPLG